MNNTKKLRKKTWNAVAILFAIICICSFIIGIIHEVSGYHVINTAENIHTINWSDSAPNSYILLRSDSHSSLYSSTGEEILYSDNITLIRLTDTITLLHDHGSGKEYKIENGTLEEFSIPFNPLSWHIQTSPNDKYVVIQSFDTDKDTVYIYDIETSTYTNIFSEKRKNSNGIAVRTEWIDSTDNSQILISTYVSIKEYESNNPHERIIYSITDKKTTKLLSSDPIPLVYQDDYDLECSSIYIDAGILQQFVAPKNNLICDKENIPYILKESLIGNKKLLFKNQSGEYSEILSWFSTLSADNIKIYPLVENDLSKIVLQLNEYIYLVDSTTKEIKLFTHINDHSNKMNYFFIDIL